jgi:hypothetical protein
MWPQSRLLFMANDMEEHVASQHRWVRQDNIGSYCGIWYPLGFQCGVGVFGYINNIDLIKIKWNVSYYTDFISTNYPTWFLQIDTSSLVLHVLIHQNSMFIYLLHIIPTYVVFNWTVPVRSVLALLHPQCSSLAVYSLSSIKCTMCTHLAVTSI